MTESIKALSRIFVSIVKIDLGKGDCIVIKNGEDKGMDLNGITRLEELCRVLSQRLFAAEDAERLAAFLLSSSLSERLSQQFHLHDDFRFKES